MSRDLNFNSKKEKYQLRCQQISQLQGEERSYGHFPQSNVAYLIRPFAQVNQCLTIEEQLIEQSSHNCSLQRCWSSREASVNQVFTFSGKSAFQRKFTVAVEGLLSRPILMAKEATFEIYASTIPNSLINFSWGIESYFRPIKNTKGELLAYQKQKGCFLIFHSLKKQCLAISKKTDKLMLLPYEKEIENLDLVWFFEKVQ